MWQRGLPHQQVHCGEDVYDIEIDFLRIKFDEDDYPITSKSRVQNWYKLNKRKFELLADKLCDDVFYILFSNRILLQQFNIIISRDFEKFKFLNLKGIKHYLCFHIYIFVVKQLVWRHYM